LTSRIGKGLVAAVLVATVAGTTAVAAGSGGPKTRKGKSAQLVVNGVAIPTAFAFGDGQVFFSDGIPPSEAPLGGVYVIKHGAAVKLPGSPPLSFGVAWHKGKLYVSGLNDIQAWSGWNGTTFTKQKTIYKVDSKKFTGFNGLGFGANGRLYVGVDLGDGDHAPPSSPYQYDILSMTATGKHVKVTAHGIRQPWQMAFPKGSSSPYVSDLGQEGGAKNPPDAILRVKQGQAYGFPKCNWTKPGPCQGKAKPFQLFPSHTDAMGLGILGKRLFISEFGGSTHPRVVSIPLKGGKQRVELKGFPQGHNVVGLGVHNGWVYVGMTAKSAKSPGAIYRFKP
jgi:glucose/arabinose dehydrogenase